jgi:metallo-beta-lactamase class B
MKKNGLLTAIIVLAGWTMVIAQTNQKITVDDDIQLIHLQDSVFVHVTWHQTEPYGRFPSNGLVIIRQGYALMIDTPMDNDKTERLTKYLKDSLSAELTKLIVGHFHDDCLGGLAYLQGIGIESIANSLTIDKCKELGLPVPSTSFTDSMVIDFHGEHIDCRFFGAGHSFDNIAVWIPGKKILFGGCLVKSVDSKGLGNLSDAVVPDWDTTIRKIMDTYEDILLVIPGHGDVGGVELLTHTMRLVEKEKNK